MKKKIAALLLTISLVIVLTGCGESWERTKKDLVSEYTGGLERVVEVINIDGEVIKRYEGKFDVQADQHKVKFIQDGKVVILYRSATDIIVVEEK
ncbi:DUF5052 family protein [Geobacillus phage GR1]|nr:DUF5052 family protein [Geobacillus phage GR1]